MRPDQQHVERPKRSAAPAVEPLEGRALLSVLPTFGAGGGGYPSYPPSSPSPTPTPSPTSSSPSSTPVTTPTSTPAPSAPTSGTVVTLPVPGSASTPPPAASPSGARHHGHALHSKASGVVTKAPAFYSFYTGPQWAELNAVKASGTLVSGHTFVFTGTNQGPITQGPATYVWGVDRSGNLPPGPFAGRPDVTFDAVIVVRLDSSLATTAQVMDLASGTTTTLPAHAVRIHGATIQVKVPASLLPSTGLPPSQYGFNYWPEDGGPPISSSVASFLPESTDAQVGTSGRR